jgi:hypothetical protein
MKNILSIMFLIFFLLSCQKENDDGLCPECSDSDSIIGDIIAHYMLDGNALDTSVNGIDGLIYGNPEISSDRYNNPNSAIHFDGVDDFISAEIGNHDPIAISLWFAHRNNEMGKAYVIFDYGENAFSSEVDMTTGATRTNCYINDTNLIEMFSPKMEYSSGMAWHHLYIDSGNDTISPRMFIDGNPEGTLDEKQSLNIITGLIYIGRPFSNTFTQASYFDGKIDDIIIYNRILNEEEIDSLFGNYSIGYY